MSGTGARSFPLVLFLKEGGSSSSLELMSGTGARSFPLVLFLNEEGCPDNEENKIHFSNLVICQYSNLSLVEQNNMRNYH